jgi:hypothetical protein
MAARLATALTSSTSVRIPRTLVDAITRTVLPDVHWRAIQTSPRFRRLLDRHDGGSTGVLTRDQAARIYISSLPPSPAGFKRCAGIPFRDWR